MAVISKDLGPVSAYAVAVANGFTGTEAEWEQYIANASTAAQSAAGSATAAASSASAAAQSATAAAASQVAAAGSETEAANYALVAGNHATAAAASATAAETAETGAETAQAAAEAAQAAAEAVAESIPEDYTELTEEVGALKSALNGGTLTVGVSSGDVHASAFWADVNDNGKLVLVDNASTSPQYDTLKDGHFIDVSDVVAGTTIATKASLYLKRGVFIVDEENNILASITGATASDYGYSASAAVQDVVITVPVGAKYLVQDMRNNNASYGLAWYAATMTVNGAEKGVRELKESVGRIASQIETAMMNSSCRAVLSRPLVPGTETPIDLTGLDDITVYAAASGYGVTAKPEDYMNTINTAVYVDAVDGADTNAGTEALPKKTIGAALTAGADTVYLADGTYTFPDGGISVDINLIGTGENVVVSGGAYFTGDITVYVENIDFNGGNSACKVEVGDATQKPQFCANNCIFENSTSTNGLSILGEVTVRIFDCTAKNNKKDGFNYHKNTDVGSGAPNIMEYRCTAYGNGATDTDPTSDNGSTAHNYSKIIRVGGNYHHNHGGNIADKSYVMAWCVGCIASDSQETAGNVNNADFWTETYSNMYCDNCYASGSTYDGWAKDNSHLHVAGGRVVNTYLDDTSDRVTYTSEATFKYQAG